MVGQQHDISECMDNILFQVEAALASEKGACDSEESNLVKRQVAYEPKLIGLGN